VAEYEYRRPTAADIQWLADNLRPEDRKEIGGMTGYNFHEEIQYCVDNSECCWACCLGEKVLAAFGVICTNPMERQGIVWMLASTETAKHKIYTGRWTKKGISALLHDWKYLYNYVDEGNDGTIAWLKWMGATVHPAQPMGLYGLPYHLFTFEGR